MATTHASMINNSKPSIDLDSNIKIPSYLP
jgi:hypothetical protein